MANQPKKKTSTNSNTERRNGKAPKQHPKEPVRKRSAEQLATVEAARQDRRAAHRAEVLRQLEEKKAADLLKFEQKQATNKRMSASQKKRELARQRSLEVAKSTIQLETELVGTSDG